MKPAEQNLVSPLTLEKMKPAERNLVSPRTTETKKSAEQNLVPPWTSETKKSAEQTLVPPQTSKKKILSYDQKLTSSETQEKKDSSDHQELINKMKSLATNDKPLHGEHAQRKSLRTRRINLKLSKIVEKKVPEANQISMSSENHETTASKTSNQNIVVKKDSSRSKVQNTNTSTIPG
ncbi:hypothetical protein HAX54_004209 [Datura stramonium]|uniref:Uncharacterized protein n=1 Tax=Datura stramonium TaxID=4076 RepID=A0ABS8WV80_DATST|nr:hypothetical protein [Datura stramonium]